MTIAPNSASYPILGACQATGVDYALGLKFVETGPRMGPEPNSRSVKAEIVAAHGVTAAAEFIALIIDAHDAGRLRVKRWPEVAA